MHDHPIRSSFFLRGIHMRSLMRTPNTTDQVHYLIAVGEQGAQHDF